MIAVRTIIGLSWGTVTYQKVCHELAPSTLAASTLEASMFCSAAR